MHDLVFVYALQYYVEIINVIEHFGVNNCMNFYIIICNFTIKTSALLRSCAVILSLNNHTALAENER